MYTALFSIICINYALLPIFKYIFLLTFYGVPDDYLMNFPYAAVYVVNGPDPLANKKKLSSQLYLSDFSMIMRRIA